MNSLESSLTHLPDGSLNLPFLLAQANLLLEENDLEHAFALFLLAKGHPKYGFCGHYGIGRCFLSAHLPEPALQAFEKAMSLARRPYIAEAMLEALLACGDFGGAEKRAVVFAREFGDDENAVMRFRRLHETAMAKQIP